ncbi:MerR family transcriptional regulator [Schumannella sp. 10F1B-5-1]|uniref:helix-turn-helix domain-containing protein n=1 Tax=Schumannella sp. 10F1B-5-1 TaxID=2590780 RepID=UPI0011312BA0|nr:MerR family transcriptional regulator [Schumannella sp. 10F1B-5-1]TPW78413.1 MerR family transcriptional regulator [Schumannella sp. 10F1B-5-1]
MTWSTRRLAEIAGTTVKAIRYYHRAGLLDEPERTANGYKQYRTDHLVRLLQIRRMSELGIPLAQLGAFTAENRDEAVAELDASLAAEIVRLTRVRAELAALSATSAPLELPPRFADVADQLSASERVLVLVLSRLFDESALGDLHATFRGRTAIDDDFDALPDDADDQQIAELAERMVPEILDSQRRYPWLEIPSAGSELDPVVFEETVATVMIELFTPAQLRVLVAADALGQRMRDQEG